MTQQPHDLLHDMLAAAAGGPVREATGATVRRRAVQRRNRRRAVAAGTLSLAAAAVLVGVTVGGTATLSTDLQPLPAGPSQDVVPPTPDPSREQTVPAPTPSPTSPMLPAPGTPRQSPPPTTDVVASSPPTGLSAEEAQQGLAAFRLPGEDERESQSTDEFPHLVSQSIEPWAVAAGCGAPVEVAPRGALAMRTSTLYGPDNRSARQIAVFPDAAVAGAAFAELLETVRVCSAVTAEDVSLSQSFLGGRLAHGDESYWTAFVPKWGEGEIDPALAESTRPLGMDGLLYGSEKPFGAADILVLDGNVVTVASDPAYLDTGRADTVARLSDEWEQTRGRYAALLR